MQRKVFIVPHKGFSFWKKVWQGRVESIVEICLNQRWRAVGGKVDRKLHVGVFS